ncbi:MAG TPA: hypothetical protein VIY72_08805 [Acidimicrobiales bacterium]
MNGRQQVILCVALGAVHVVLGFAARAWWWERSPSSGWFNYAPNNGVVFSSAGPDRGAIIAQAALWIALVAVWAGACLVLLRTRTSLDRVAPEAE